VSRRPLAHGLRHQSDQPHECGIVEQCDDEGLRGICGTIDHRAGRRSKHRQSRLARHHQRSDVGHALHDVHGTPYTLYPWTFDAHVPAPNYWSPQTVVPDVATSQGHLELFASAAGSSFFDTFSQAAATSLGSALSSGTDPATAGNQFSDGKSTVLFDQTGVGYGAGGPWVNVQGMVSDSHVASFSPVAWSVGYYTVEGGKKAYGLICAPTTGGPYPLVIYNHGGTAPPTAATSAVSSPPPAGRRNRRGAPDGLGQCIDWAKRGWVFATSSYRGENVNITSSSPQFASNTWTSDGDVEFCMGEVTDVMALTDLLVKNAGAISVGGNGQMVPLKVNGKVLMYGYSHGGCITHRAVEQGAAVTAYSVIEGFTDLRLGYLTARSAGFPSDQAAVLSGAFQPPVQPGVVYYLPDANGRDGI